MLYSVHVQTVCCAVVATLPLAVTCMGQELDSCALVRQEQVSVCWLVGTFLTWFIHAYVMARRDAR